MGASVSISFCFGDLFVSVFMTFHYFKNYLRYLLCSRHWRGYGVHSPFAFDLVTNVIREELPYYKYSLVEKVRNLYGTSKHSLMVDGREVALSELCRDEVSPATGELLFRLVNKYKPSNVISLKLGLGISAMYMAAPNSKLDVVTFEENSELAGHVSRFLGKAGFEHVRVAGSSAKTDLPSLLAGLARVDFVCLNARTEDLDACFALLKPKFHDHTVVVMNDIYKDERATAVWRRIQAEEQVRVTVDLFRLGIAFMDSSLQKEDYFVRYLPGIHL